MRVARLPRMSAVETREKIIAELLEILPMMEQARTSDVEGNRSGAAMGWMLVTKMAMWNKDYDTALSAIARLEEIYGSLDQYPIDDIMFRNKNTPRVNIRDTAHIHCRRCQLLVERCSHMHALSQDYRRGHIQRCGDTYTRQGCHSLVAYAPVCLFLRLADV